MLKVVATAAAIFIAGISLFAIEARAQVLPAQNQVIFGPYPAGFVVSTSSSATHKLGATTTPYFSNFFANFGTIQYASSTAISAFSASSTFATLYDIVSHVIRGDASDGLLIESNNGTDVAILGAGGGSNATFYGGVNIDGATRLATSLTGALTANSGAVSAVATTSVSCAGTASCTSFAVFGSSPVTITGSGLTTAVTAIGPAGQTSDGPTVTLATSSDTNIGLTITGSGDTQTFTSNWIGTLDNARLTNSTVSYGGVTLSLGGSDATPAFNLADATNLPIVGGTTGTLTVARGGTGSTTAPISQIIYGGGDGTYQSRATTTAACAGTVSCPTFDILGAAPVTITGSGGGSGTVSTSTNEIAGRLPYWTSTSGTPATLGQVSTTTLTISGPFNNSAVPVVIGSSPITSTYYGLATTSQPSASQLLVSNGGAGVFGVSTSSATINNGLTGALVTIGSGQTIGLATIAANSILANQTSGAAVPSALATSTLAAGLYTGTPGQILARLSNGTWTGVATTTAGTGLTYTGTAFNVNTSQNIATLSNLTTDGVVYTSGANGTLNVDAGALDYARGGTGSTTAPIGQLLYGGTSAYQSVATTSVSCSGTVTCTGFTAIGAAPITINGTGGGSGNMSGWATTTTAGQLLLYPVDAQTTDVLFGTSATTTAPFWWDVSATTTYIGQTGTGDASITLAPDGQSTTTIGVHASSDSYRIAPGINLENPFATFLQNGKVGIGTTTPFGTFSISTSTVTSPLFSIGTTTGGIYAELMNVWATTTTQLNTSALALPDTSGVRAIIGGLLSYAQLAASYVQLNIAGWFDQTDSQVFCDQPVGPIAIAADGIAGCTGFSFMEDGTGTLTGLSTTDSGYTYAQISTTAANDGAGVFLNAPSAGGLTIATSTPIFSADARIASVQLATTSHQFFIGFTNLATAGTTFETAPTQGCYFTASSSQANWKAVSRNSAANITITDTGIASSTVTTGTGGWRRFRIVTDASRCLFFIQNGQSNDLVQVANHTNNLPTSVLNAGVYMSDTVAGAGALFNVRRIRAWWRDFLPAG